MRRMVASLVFAAVAVGLAVSASAHSVEDLEAILSEEETYFQPIDRAAPDFVLRTAGGDPVRLDDLRGKVVVLHFIYASCLDICPLHAERLAEVQDMVNQTPMQEQVRFVTVTTDPGRDVAEVMDGYGPAHGLDPVNWLFLTVAPGQPEDTTRKLAESYGHSFTSTGEGYQVHGVVTHIIDKEGRWRANFHGLEFDPTNMVLFINGLTNAEVPHGHPEPDLWDQIRQFFQE